MKKYNLFTSKEIKPIGYIKNQLKIQAEGLSGNLDKMWRDIRDSKWIGGDAEGWERVPYWLDGFIPMAYLLEDEDLIARGKKYIEAIIANQKENGWICPCSDEEIPYYDTWAVQLITKTLKVYYDCSKDERIPGILYKVLKNYFELLKNGTVKLFTWGKHRWFECFVAINFIYEIYKEDWIIELASTLREQGYEPLDFAHTYKTPISQIPMHTHIVNLAMMLKYEAISHDILGRDYENNAEYLYQTLYNYNGTPVELFTGDEHLSGLSPINGTELCAVVEQMFSYEILYAFTGDERWLERLEVIAFNALPGTFSDDMWTHQYDQMSNQINCIKFPRYPVFGTNNPDSHLFGLEPNYGCCTANLSQGWPKFIISAFMYNDNEIINTLQIPTKLTCNKANIELNTEYPFKNTFNYKIEAKEDFTFTVRIPSFVKKLFLNGDEIIKQDKLIFALKAGESREITIGYKVEAEFINRPYSLKSVKYGSLVFSLPIEAEWKMYEYERNGVERKFPYCDYELIGKSDWNYGFSDVRLKVEEREVTEVPFSSKNPPIVIRAKMKHIPWGYERMLPTVCARVPKSTESYGSEETLTLYPYGCAKLRMTEMPMVD